MICVFDCETVPDAKAIRDINHYDGEDREIVDRFQAEFLEKNGTSFLPLPYHKVVSISALIADSNGFFQKVGNFGEGSREEGDIVASFINFINLKNPRLVSFNGRSFDIPMLLVRAMKYNISFGAFFEKDNPQANKSKWDNYRQRYSEDFHTDLMDSIGNFGAARGLKLDELCKIQNIPGKYDVSGDEVLELYYSNKQELIDEYCQSDCINTYWLLLKYELLRGTILIGDYKEILNDFLIKLPTHKGYSEIFFNSIEQELQRLGVD